MNTFDELLALMLYQQVTAVLQKQVDVAGGKVPRTELTAAIAEFRQEIEIIALVKHLGIGYTDSSGMTTLLDRMRLENAANQTNEP